MIYFRAITDIKELTIRNLDTGEQFVIGENYPDFEFDTFEIGKCGASSARQFKRSNTQVRHSLLKWMHVCGVCVEFLLVGVVGVVRL